MTTNNENAKEMSRMEFVPIRELCTSPKKISARLKRDGRIVITNNGRPTAIMLDVDSSTFEETLIDLRRLQAKRALRELQTESVKNGTSKMTMTDIETEIAETRVERAAREN
jgi:PHD/YefM family antitoxin component YafN of YafNO toxin-antitoxin module